MIRPWQYWTLYAVTLGAVLVAMSWLTLKALEVDRAEALARRQAEQEEDIGRVLWRMDVALMPHLAREAARPHFVYQPVLNDAALQSAATASVGEATNGSAAAPALSPLLTDRAEFVVVNFQVDPRNHWSSPQAPAGDICAVACGAGASMDEIKRCTTMLEDLRTQVTYADLTETLGGASATPAAEQIVQNSAVEAQLAKPLPQTVVPQSKSEDVARLQRTQAKVGSDLFTRNQALQSFTQQEKVDQRMSLQPAPAEPVREGVSQPLWVGSHLLLARQVDTAEQVVIQGCWLDWPQIRRTLIADVADLLPDVGLEPVLDSTRADANRMLATLPVQLVVPPVTAGPPAWSTMRVSLATAWACLLLAATAGGVLLHGVLTLSERRAAFVSAVTHELRTPLTTFRMYSEMLAQDMLPDEAQRRRYLETLRLEADRLSHLVENVLAYARLERGRRAGRIETLAVDELLDRVASRLHERAAQAEMQLLVEADNSARKSTLRTDPAAVEQILFNLVDNACKYAAASQDRRLHLELQAGRGEVRLGVRDHGAGIAARDARRLFQPFSKSADEAAHTAPGVGLGLALCQQLARELNGRLEYEPQREGGARFVLTLRRGVT